jgi:mRNA interferase RelE/StbE
MAYKIVPTAQFEKDLKRIGPNNARVILKWISANLENNKNPRALGSPLKYGLKQYWRYRIGDYRLFASIIDDQLLLELITIGHRREIYRDKTH